MMQDKVIIYNTDIDPNYQNMEDAKRKVIAAAKELGVEYDCRLSTAWLIVIPRSDREAFIQLARGMK